MSHWKLITILHLRHQTKEIPSARICAAALRGSLLLVSFVFFNPKEKLKLKFNQTGLRGKESCVFPRYSTNSVSASSDAKSAF